jgi:hypothetical protein
VFLVEIKEALRHCGMQPANKLGRLKLPAFVALRRRRAQVVDQQQRRLSIDRIAPSIQNHPKVKRQNKL